MANVGELFHGLQKSHVIELLARLYEGEEIDRAGYSRAWDTVQRLQPANTEFTVVLRQAMSLDDPPEPYVDVGGKKPNDPDGYALGWTPWSEWLSMKIEIDPKLLPMTDAQVLAHILWEMTWYGFEQSAIEEIKEETIERVEEVKVIMAADEKARSVN